VIAFPYARALVAPVISAAGILAWVLLNRLTLARADRRVTRFEAWKPGLPALVYFTTVSCAPCKTVQRPTIRKLQERFGQWFQVIEVDAGDHPELAREWGVLSVPTTFVIDAAGRPHHVNHGITSADRLIHQLELEDYAI
jgi:thiol-disulfide isomerase/thioredoxin